MNAVQYKIIFYLIFLVLTGCTGKLPEWLKSDDLVVKPAELIPFEHQLEPKILWSSQVGQGNNRSYNIVQPLLTTTSVVTVDYRGNVYNTEKSSGKRLWKLALNIPVATSAGGNDKFLFIGSQEGELITLDTKTGRYLWRAQLSSEILTPPQVNEEIVIVRTSDGKISAFSVQTGNIIWQYERAIPLLSLRGDSTVSIEENMVIAGYANGRLVALSLPDGNVIWEKTISLPRGRTEIDRLADIDATPVIQNGLIYTVAYQGNLSVLELYTGRQVWSRELSSTVGLDVAEDGTVYITDDQSYVWAIQADTGNGLWRQTSLSRRKVTTPAIAGDYIIVADLDGYIHWLSKKDGRFIARQKIAEEAITSQAVIAQSQMFILSQDGQLTAIAIPQ